MPPIPIINVSWQGVDPSQGVNPAVEAPLLVADLVRLAHDRGTSPFVVHDPVWKRSAVVEPQAVLKAVEQFDMPGGVPAALSGLFDILSNRQLVVHQDAPATLVVRMALDLEADVVIAVDGEGFPRGIFVPSNAQGRLLQTLRGRDPALLGPRLRDVIARRGQAAMDGDEVSPVDDDLVATVDAIDAELDEFHSENLNYRNPEIGVCKDHGRPHISALPCARHGAAQTLGVATLR